MNSNFSIPYSIPFTIFALYFWTYKVQKSPMLHNTFYPFDNFPLPHLSKCKWPLASAKAIFDSLPYIEVTSHEQIRMTLFPQCLSLSLFTVRIFQTDSPSYPPPHLRHLAKSLPVPKGITPTLGWCVKGFRSATKQVNSLEMIWSDVELTLNSTFSGTIMGDVAIDQYALMQTKGAVSSINVFFSLTVLHCFQFCL